MKSVRPLATLLIAAAALWGATSAEAQVNAGATLGYPGGYGIAQPSYVGPPAVVVQPAPIYVPRGGYAYPGWRERERPYRNDEQQRYWEHDGYRGNRWHEHDGRHDGERGQQHDRHDGRDGWRH